MTIRAPVGANNNEGYDIHDDDYNEHNDNRADRDDHDHDFDDHDGDCDDHYDACDFYQYIFGQIWAKKGLGVTPPSMVTMSPFFKAGIPLPLVFRHFLIEKEIWSLPPLSSNLLCFHSLA